MILWFGAIGLLGGWEIARRPSILLAVDPRYAVNLMLHQPWHGFVLLGSVVLAVTGAEALYADMGHFGRSPIRRAWLRFVFPALLLNYFGQGALLLAHPGAIENPFFLLAPGWALYPLVALASTATVIASQAVISGAFSITRQAVQLGYLPRMLVRHTSEQEIGQVYVPAMNGMLLVAVVATVIGFRSSDALGGAYGVAVTGTMTVTTVLAFVYFRWGAGWRLWRLVPLFALFLGVDLSFFGANLLKIIDGGWFPLAIAGTIYAVMMTWLWGRRADGGAARERRPAARHLDREFAARPSGARPRHRDLHDGTGRQRARGAAPQHEAQQDPARAQRVDDGAHRGRAAPARSRPAADRSSEPEFSHRDDPLRLSRRARHPARAGAVPRRRVSLQPDGDLVLRRPRKGCRQGPAANSCCRSKSCLSC